MTQFDQSIEDSENRSWSAASIIIGAEMFERMAYYGVRVMLVLYMIQSLSFANEKAFLVYGIYTALIYMLPVISGLVIDFLLDKRYAMLGGSLFMGIGALIMIIPGETGLLIGLATIAVGNGFFKGTITASLGDVFPGGPEKLDAGYSLYYIFINIGALLATVVIAYIGETAGFGSAMMVCAVCAFLTTGLIGLGTGLGILKQTTTFPQELANPPKVKWTGLIFLPVFALLIPLLLISMLSGFLAPFQEAIMPGLLFLTLVAGLTAGFLGSKGREWIGMLTIILIICGNLMFWVGFETIGGMLSNLTYEVEQEMNFGSGLMQFFNPFFIILFGGGLFGLWYLVKSFQSNLATVIKIMLGAFFLGLSIWIIMHDLKSGSVDLNTLVLHFAFATLGELLLSPIMLSFVWKNAPPKVRTTVFGLFMASFGLSNYIAAALNDGADLALDSPEMLIDAMYGALGTILFGGIVAIIVWKQKSIDVAEPVEQEY